MAALDHPTAFASLTLVGTRPVGPGVGGRVRDRTPGTSVPVQMANQLGLAFPNLECAPRWRERLPELTLPTLVVHGRHDRFFPLGNGEALARQIPGARLLVLEAATALPDVADDGLAAAKLAPTRPDAPA